MFWRKLPTDSIFQEAVPFPLSTQESGRLIVTIATMLRDEHYDQLRL